MRRSVETLMAKKKKKYAAVGTKQLPLALCPYCGAGLSGVTGVAYNATVAPQLQPGMASVCCYCFSVMRFDGRFFQKVTQEEADAAYRASGLLRDFRDAMRSRQRDEIASKTGGRHGPVN